MIEWLWLLPVAILFFGLGWMAAMLFVYFTINRHA